VTVAPTRTGKVEKISIIAPMYNEAAHVEHLVEDIAAQDFDGAVEVFVADGASTDGSAEALRATADRAGLELTIVPNPERWVSHGLNRCIRRCTGDLIVRLDCHSRYPPDYLRRSAAAAEETGAAAVGGVPVPVGRTLTERAVACALDSPFGGVHWTRHGGTATRVEVDNFYCGAFRPEALDRSGLFDESLVRNQDDELNYRIRATGGTLVLDTSIRSVIFPRSRYSRAFRQYYEYGLWKIPVMSKHRNVLSGRSLAPLGLVGSLALLAPAAVWSRGARHLLAAEAAVYAVAAVGFGAESVRRRGEPLRLLPRVVSSFPTFHIGYGVGMLVGLFRATRRP
jgi:glycosyltransferase involved in cell wall biosynthesis